MVVLCVTYLFSNFVVLNSDEQAFVLRFGKLVGETRTDQVKKPGRSYFVLPKPISEVVHTPTGKARVVSTSFWYNETIFEESQQSTSFENPLIPGIDGYLLTGDGNIIHARWSLSFMIKDPVQYHHSYLEPETLIRHILSNIVLKETASVAIADAVYYGSERLREHVEKRVKQALDRQNVGLATDSTLKVFYDQREVPRGVVQAFTGVIEAEQELSKKSNEAKVDAERIIQNAHGESVRIKSEAMAYSRQTIASTKADADYFTSVLPKYRLAPRTLFFSLYQETLGDILANAKDVYLVNDDQEIRVLTNRQRRSNRSKQE